MSPSIFLTLLCLGVASAAPAAPAGDLSAEAQAEQWVAAVIWDTVGNVGNCTGACREGSGLSGLQQTVAS